MVDEIDNAAFEGMKAGAAIRIADLESQVKRLEAALAYLRQRAPVGIGFRRNADETEYWVGGHDGPVYASTLLEAIEKAADASEGEADAK